MSSWPGFLNCPATPIPGQHWSEWPAAEDTPSGMAHVGLTHEPQITASSAPELPWHAMPPAPASWLSTGAVTDSCLCILSTELA